MKKQIFISKPKSSTVNSLLFNASITGIRDISILIILGLVNQQLNNKANCKEITSIKHRESYYSITEGCTFEEGYLITYIESEMQFTQEEVERIYNLADTWVSFEEWCNTYLKTK